MTDVRLIVIRGNSGSGKSAVSASLRQAYGRGVAVVSQDLIRRDILRERDHSDAVNIGLIDQVARYSLAHGYHVVLDGILAASRYEQMLAGLKRAHGGPSYFYYIDVGLVEALRRHRTRPLRSEVSESQLRDWYRSRDLLAAIGERIIPEISSLEQTVAAILAETGLLTADILRARAPGAEDLASWLELVAEVEPLFGPMPDFAEHARRAIGRNSALVVRDRHDQVLGAALLSLPAPGVDAALHASGVDAASHAPGRRIRWLAVRADARRRGAGRALLSQILARWPPPGDIDVVTFGDDVADGQPARALYASFGFVPAQMLANGPEGGSRQRFVLPQP